MTDPHAELVEVQTYKRWARLHGGDAYQTRAIQVADAAIHALEAALAEMTKDRDDLQLRVNQVLENSDGLCLQLAEARAEVDTLKGLLDPHIRAHYESAHLTEAQTEEGP